MRSQLADAFEESLCIAPDPADVLVGIRSGIVRQRRRRQLYRTIAVVQAVALVLVATAVTTMALRNRNAPAPANQLDEWTSTLQPGAIPDGWVVRNIMSNAIAENISYGNDTGEGLRVTLDKVGTSPRTDMPGWERTEINGRPAWQLPGDDFRAIIQWQLPSGRWAEVDFAKHYPQSSSPELRAPEVARQVAETTRESGTTRLVTGFEPTYLPAGIRVGGVEVEPAAPGFGTLLATSGTPRTTTNGDDRSLKSLSQLGSDGRDLYVRVSADRPDPAMMGERIADIQGRPAYKMRTGHGVMVSDFHGGVLSVGTYSDLSTAVLVMDLVKIAEGVRWVG
jgi:hypothetical protein